MVITHEISLDLQKNDGLQRIDVVQGDAFTRQVTVKLLNGGEPWHIPVCDMAVRYLKQDGTAGIYDRLPNGDAACVYSENVITVLLAPQMLTCAGAVQVQVEMTNQNLRIATFTFLVAVEQAVAQDGESEDYVNWNGAFLPQVSGAEAGQLLQIGSVDDQGRILELEPVDNSVSALAQQVTELDAQLRSESQRIEEAGREATDALNLAKDAIPCPYRAQEGQVLAVRSVDTQGHPTEWETVDAGSGSDAGAYYITVTDNGDGSFSKDRTMAQIMAAHDAGKSLFCIFTMGGIPIVGTLVGYGFFGGSNVATFAAAFPGTASGDPVCMVIGYIVGDTVHVAVTEMAKKTDIQVVPAYLPNPHSLSIGDQVYDGSQPVSVELPAGQRETVLVDLTVEEDVAEIQISMAEHENLLRNCADLLFCCSLTKPAADESEGLGTLNVAIGYLHATGGVIEMAPLLRGLDAVPTNAISYINLVDATVQIHNYGDEHASRNGYVVRSVAKQNQSPTVHFEHAFYDSAMTIEGELKFFVSASHPMGKGSTIKLIARG